MTRDGPTVMRVCRALLGPVDAEDAWSETFLAALRAYPSLRPGSNVRGWLVTIAHHKAIDQLRAINRRPTPRSALPERGSGGGDLAELVERWDPSLLTALRALPPKQQRAVIFHHVAGLPYAEVGALMEISAAAARRNAADGIAHLRTSVRTGAST